MSEPPARIVRSIVFAYIGFQLISVPDFIHSGPNEAGFNWRIKSDLSWDKQRTHKHSEASYMKAQILGHWGRYVLHKTADWHV